MQKDPLFRTTLVTALAMVGAVMLFVGGLSLLAVFVTEKAVNAGHDGATEQAPAVKAGAFPARAAKS